MDESGDISKSGLREALNTDSSANLISMDQHGEIGSIFDFFFKIQGIPVHGYFFQYNVHIAAVYRLVLQ